MRKTASGLCLALVCAGLASCSKGGANACSVTPNGKFGSPVTVTVDCPKGAGRLTRETVLEGKGNRIVDGQTVLMRATSFDSRNGEIIKAYNTGELRLAAVTKKGMGDLAKRLVGVREGSRLVIKRPGLVEGVPTASEIIVVDLLFTVAHGKAVPVPNPAPSGMPQVGTADGGGPSIKSPGGAIPSLETVPLVVGNGPQVTEGQTLAVQYALFDQNGKSVDEMIAKNGSFRLSLQEGWLTQEIMMETLKQMAGEYTDEQLLSMGYTEEQVAQIQELAKTGMSAAQDIKTFSQLMGVIGEDQPGAQP